MITDFLKYAFYWLVRMRSGQHYAEYQYYRERLGYGPKCAHKYQSRGRANIRELTITTKCQTCGIITVKHFNRNKAA